MIRTRHIVFLAAIVLSACSGDPKPLVYEDASSGRTVSLDLDDDALSVFRNEARPFRVYATDVDGVRSEVTATSRVTAADPTIVTVAGHKLLGVMLGATTVTAEFDGKAVTVPVKVDLPPVIRFRIQPAPVQIQSMRIGDVMDYRAFVLRRDSFEEDVSAYVTWSTDSPGVVRVQSGRVTAVGEGKASVSAVWGDYSGTIEIGVLR